MALQNSDLLVVERGGVRYQMTASDIADFLGAVRDFSVADIAARDGLSDLKIGDRVFVSDASADGTVTSGWAIYRVQSTGPNVFEKIQEGEGLDVVGAGNTDLGYTPSPTNGTVTSSTGNDTVIPAVTGTNAGLATPAMLNNSHAAVTLAGTSASNPLTLSGQELGFDIGQLDPLP